MLSFGERKTIFLGRIGVQEEETTKKDTFILNVIYISNNVYNVEHQNEVVLDDDENLNFDHYKTDVDCLMIEITSRIHEFKMELVD